MKKLLFDLLTTQPSRSSRFHGGGVYGQRVFSALHRRLNGLNSEVRLCAAANPELYLPPELTALLESDRIDWLPVRGYEELIDLVGGGEFDRFYTPIANWLFGRREIHALREQDVRATIHQLRPLDAPGDPYARLLQPSPAKRLYRRVTQGGSERQRSRQYRKIAQALPHIGRPIITVSEHSRFQIATEFPEVAQEEIVVADSPIPPEKSEFAKDSELPEVLRELPYLLMLNANRGAKNPVRVLEAIHRYQPKALNRCRVVFGGMREEQLRFLLRRFPKAEPFVRLLPPMEQPVFNLAMSNALGLLYPSISEGFGYPPLEAMGLGVPVLASPVTSVHEITGDAALYLDPWSPNEIAYRINEFVLDDTLRAELVKKGYRRIAMYRSRQEEMSDRIIHALLGDWL